MSINGRISIYYYSVSIMNVIENVTTEKVAKFKWYDL